MSLTVSGLAEVSVAAMHSLPAAAVGASPTDRVFGRSGSSPARYRRRIYDMATILVVDDQPTNRAFLVTLLSYHGHCLCEVADGAEALALARGQPPDLIISDILLPTMDGFELSAICVLIPPWPQRGSFSAPPLITSARPAPWPGSGTWLLSYISRASQHECFRR